MQQKAVKLHEIQIPSIHEKQEDYYASMVSCKKTIMLLLPKKKVWYLVNSIIGIDNTF